MTAACKLDRAADRPRHIRERLKPDLARASRLGREAAGVSQRELALQLDVQPSHVARTELAAEPHAPTLTHVACGPSEWAEVLIRWAASPHRLQVLAAVEVRHGDDHVARLASVTAESTDVLRALSAAIATGDLSDSVLERIGQEAREEAQAALELDAWVAAELRRRRSAR